MTVWSSVPDSLYSAFSSYALGVQPFILPLANTYLAVAMLPSLCSATARSLVRRTVAVPVLVRALFLPGSSLKNLLCAPSRFPGLYLRWLRWTTVRPRRTDERRDSGTL